MRAFALIWRLVRRGTVLNRAQAVLIVALIALPMLGLSGTVLVIQSRQATDAEALTALFGRNASRVQWVTAPDPTLTQKPPGSGNWDVKRDAEGFPVHDNPDVQSPSLALLLPAGTRVLRLADSDVSVTSRAGIADLPATLGPVWDPSFRGRFSITEGHAPQNAHELMVSAPTLARLGIEVGGEVQLREPVSGSYTVTGLIADTRVPRSTQEVFLPDGAFDGTSAEPGPEYYSYYLPTLNLSAKQAVPLNHAGYVVSSRALAAQYGMSEWWDTIQSRDDSLWVMLGVALLFGAFLAVLLAGSAFVIGARQRQRVLAVIASTGAPRGTLFGLLSATGVALGAVGGALGAAAGVGAGALYLRLTADGSAAHYPGFHFTWWLYALVVAFAAFVGFVAALLPAITVSRLDVVAALRGSRRPVKPRPRRPIIGAIVALVGAAATLGAGLGIAGIEQGWFSGSGLTELLPEWLDAYTVTGFALAGGVIVLQIGLIIAAGVVLAGVQLALRRSGISARLASRDLGRNRSRAVPAIASIMTTTFLAVLAMTSIASDDATNAAWYRWNLADQNALGWVSGGDVSDAARGEKLSELTSAMSRTLDLGKPTVISGVADAEWQEDMSKDTKLYPVPMTPKANACPTADAANGSTGIDWASPDWRCNDLGVDYRGHPPWIPTIVVGDAAALEAIIGQRPSAAGVEALASGGAVSLHRAFVGAGNVLTLGWYTAEASLNRGEPTVAGAASPEKTATVPVVYQPTEHSLAFGVVLSPAAAKRLAIAADTNTVIAPLASAPTSAQRDALLAATQMLERDQWNAETVIETGPSGSPPVFLWGALGVSGLIAVASAVVALTLARQDGARDTAVLNAVGASPGVRRRLASWQGAVVVGSGAMLGALTATLTAYALYGIRHNSVFAMPWLEVAIATAGLTLVVAGGAWVAAGAAKPAEQGRRAIA